jgi:DNA-binding NarL/FixJ family response regulator
MKHQKKIAIIEDELKLRENISEILQISGYSIVTADSGESGVALIQHEMPDLILCDIKMPGKDGFWVLEQIRNMEKYASIPFIFLTAKVEHKDIRAGMGLGADDYITKPFSVRDLTNAIAVRLKRNELLKSYSSTAESGQVLTQQEIQAYTEKYTNLTKSEKRIFSLIAEGFSSVEIAKQLHNSVKTIENHRSNIILKLGLKGHLSLVKFCITMNNALKSSV